ncbi:MAG: hypothetical protein M1366_06220 [Patescibacteria group bacterium]|nr:hypothetical protein [Patescibacteria group bacterium]
MSTKKLLFIHHSTGANLIRQGNLRQILKKKIPTLQFWDHSYNLLPLWQVTARIVPYQTGLSDKDGHLTGIDFRIEIANTDPQGYANLFSQPVNVPADNAFSKIVTNFDIVMFKSCFPVTKIESNRQLEHYKNCYIKIRDNIDRLPDKYFILFTPPPLRREMTKSEYAVRARKYADWMKSVEYIGKRENMAVFDLFDILSDNEGENANLLKRSYCPFLFFDSHPNKKANNVAALKLIGFLLQHLKKVEG